MKRSVAARLRNLLLISSAVAATLLAGCKPGNIEVETSYGIVAGMQDETLSRFLGIPYAKPPIGDLRWADPQPPEAWEGVYQATQFKPACMQQETTPTVLVEQEDCLTLNIWAPNTPGPHPVMFWVHGGGNETGSASEPYFDGSKLAASQNVVFVSINYRLNAYGFFALPSINGAPAINGNQGIKDQIAALQWVQGEITHFSGDPNNVTVVGHSGGATDICALLATPKTGAPKRLLHKAIMQSGACETLEITDLATAQQHGLDYINALGCSDASDPLACARALPAQRESFKTALVIDGDVLPQHPLDLLANTDKSDTPLLIGTNKDEWSVVVGQQDNPADEAGYLALLAKDFPGEETALASLYPLGNYPTSGQAHADLLGDDMFHCPALDTAHAWSAHNNTWLYHFTHDINSLYSAITALSFGENAPEVGTFHGAEWAYIFDDTLFATRDLTARHMLHDLFQNAWGNFARSGNPNGESVPQWDTFDAARDNYLDISESPQNRDGLRAGYCDYWLSR